MNFAKILRKPFVTEHLRWLLLTSEDSTKVSSEKQLMILIKYSLTGIILNTLTSTMSHTTKN